MSDLYEFFNKGFQKAENWWAGDCDLRFDQTGWSNAEVHAYMQGYDQYMTQEYPKLSLNYYA